MDPDERPSNIERTMNNAPILNINWRGAKVGSHRKRRSNLCPLVTPKASFIFIFVSLFIERFVDDTRTFLFELWFDRTFIQRAFETFSLVKRRTIDFLGGA